MGAFVKNHAWEVAAAIVAAVLVTCAALFAVGAYGGGSPRTDVPERASLSGYSWEELSAISAEAGACPSGEEAARVAARYNLCGDDGSPDPSQFKEIELADGRTVRAQLAGIWHDERSDGGKAGLTFVLADAVGPHAMNHAFDDPEGADADSTGGWGASDMRAWLDGELWYDLPADLRAAVVAVQKTSASRVGTGDELAEPGAISGAASDWADEASDRLWLLSASELCGTLPENDGLGVDATMAATYSAEGSQYRLFADAGVEAFASNIALIRSLAGEGRPSTWWLRTKTLEFGDGFWLVGTDGTPLNGLGEDARVVDDPTYAPDELWGPDHPRAVIIGFCL